MRLMLRHILHFALLLCVLLIFWVFFNPHRVSEEVLDLFPQDENKALIETHRNFASSRYVPLAIKGYDQSHFNQVLDMVRSFPQVAQVITTQIPIEVKLFDFLTNNQNYLLDKDFSHSQTSPTHSTPTKEISSIFSPIATQLAAQLSHFTTQTHTQKTLKAGDYGLMALVELKAQDDHEFESSLQDFKRLQTSFDDIRYFSADFMRVENLKLILNEANYLLSFASLLFILLYLLILRMPLLTFHTICTLLVSNTIAILLISMFYPKVTIMALSFGIGISNIAIDYMMHHHFFSCYTHAKSTPPPLNRPVLYGYLTTMLGFGVCLFIPFPLLAQLSVYAMISLTISYISFAFIYPRIGFAPPRLFKHLDVIRKPFIPSVVSLFIACVCIVYACLHLRLDFDLSKLDYHNDSMLEMRDFFSTLDERKSVLLLADDKTSLALIARLMIEKIPNIEFYQVNSKQNIAHSQIHTNYPYAYLARLHKNQLASLENLKHNLARDITPFLYQMDAQQRANLLNIWNKTHWQIDTRSLQNLMDSLADSIYKPMLIVLGIALISMLCALALSVRRAFIESASFVLLPLGVSLCVVASHSPFNMMHLFALLILVVVSVDYGIYAIKEGANPRTTHAIIFSALTTSVSFGILIFSQTKALNSFGEVIFSGMSCMLGLLIFGRIRN